MKDDRGAASVLVLALSLVLGLLGVAAVAVTAAAGARSHAESVADLAALAGAAALQEGLPPCAAAEAVARAGRSALLTECAVQGEVVAVAVEVVPPGHLASVGTARASAAAGPG